jgi:hypothetical protein
MSWSSEITNDPDNDYALYVELLENGEYRGRIVKGEDGDLLLIMYGCEGVKVPLGWLCLLHPQLERDLSK